MNTLTCHPRVAEVLSCTPNHAQADPDRHCATAVWLAYDRSVLTAPGLRLPGGRDADPRRPYLSLLASYFPTCLDPTQIDFSRVIILEVADFRLGLSVNLLYLEADRLAPSLESPLPEFTRRQPRDAQWCWLGRELAASVFADSRDAPLYAIVARLQAAASSGKGLACVGDIVGVSPSGHIKLCAYAP